MAECRKQTKEREKKGGERRNKNEKERKQNLPTKKHRKPVRAERGGEEGEERAVWWIRKKNRLNSKEKRK